MRETVSWNEHLCQTLVPRVSLHQVSLLYFNSRKIPKLLFNLKLMVNLSQRTNPIRYSKDGTDFAVASSRNRLRDRNRADSKNLQRTKTGKLHGMQKVLTDLADNDSNRTESRTAWRQAASSSVVRRKLTAWSHRGRVSKIIRKNFCSSDCCNTIKLFFKPSTRQRTGRVANNIKSLVTRFREEDRFKKNMDDAFTSTASSCLAIIVAIIERSCIVGSHGIWKHRPRSRNFLFS